MGLRDQPIEGGATEGPRRRRSGVVVLPPPPPPTGWQRWDHCPHAAKIPPLDEGTAAAATSTAAATPAAAATTPAVAPALLIPAWPPRGAPGAPEGAIDDGAPPLPPPQC